MTSESIDVTIGGPDDLFRIMPIMERAFAPEYGEAWNTAQCRSMLSLDGTTLFLGMFQRSVCGFAISRQVLDEAELLLFAVDLQYRRRGIGNKILQVFENKSKIMGVKTLFLEVRLGNPAQALYSENGFVEIGQRQGYYRGKSGNLYNAVTFKKFCQ